MDICMDLEKAYQIIQTKLFAWFREFVRLLPNIALASLILVLGFFLAKVLKNFSTKIVRRFTHHEAVNNLFSSFVYITTVGVSFFVALSALHLDKAVTSILAGAGIVGLGLAFAFQDIASNFMAGIFLTIRRPLKIGDLIKTGDFMGHVKTINMRDTIIESFQGQFIIIPNKDIFQNSLQNFSRSGKRRIDLSVGVSYGDDLDKVKQVTLQAVKQVSVLDPDEPPRLFYETFGDSSINYTLQLWINSTDQPIFWQGQSEAIMLIKKAYDENGITLPYPIRTLDFGIKGGENLADVLKNSQEVLRASDNSNHH
jgi:small conductance mechanosensitive channel